jgi:hypothetical protein
MPPTKKTKKAAKPKKGKEKTKTKMPQVQQTQVHVRVVSRAKPEIKLFDCAINAKVLSGKNGRTS